jgi:hypothetical protein
MKNILLYSALCVACGGVHAQTASSVQTSSTSSAAQSGAMAIGGGLATSASAGGAGGNGGNGIGGAASSNVTVNMGSSDPSGTAQPVSNAQQTSGASDPTTRIKEDIKTVGNPGAVSYGVSFSQFNCANTAAVGAGWLGGVFQLGGGLESSPCNDRANASALFQIAGALAPSNATLSSQLYHAAILLIGNSTRETKQALAQAGVADWQPAAPLPPDVAQSGDASRDYNPVDLNHH